MLSLAQDFYKLLADVLAWLAMAEPVVAARDPPVMDHGAISKEIEKLEVRMKGMSPL